MSDLRSTLALFALLMMTTGSSDAASTLRCNSKLISIEDSATEVQDKCGTPVSRDQLGYRTTIEYTNGYPTGSREVPVEEWVYGPRSGMYYYLRFEGNRLVKIDSKRN